MAKKRTARQWGLAIDRRHKPTVPEKVQAEVKAKADELVEKVLRPRYVEQPPKDVQWNYPIELWTKWRHSFFYFGSTWACPGPDALAPTFELGFARLEYCPDGLYSLAYFRHTGKWWQIHSGMTLNDCLDMIEAGGPFTLT